MADQGPGKMAYSLGIWLTSETRLSSPSSSTDESVAAVDGSRRSRGSRESGREEEGVSGADGDGVEARALQLLGADPSRDQHIPRLLIRHRVPQVHVPWSPRVQVTCNGIKETGESVSRSRQRQRER